MSKKGGATSMRRRCELYERVKREEAGKQHKLQGLPSSSL